MVGDFIILKYFLNLTVGVYGVSGYFNLVVE